jgi:TPR repeat protein
MAFQYFERAASFEADADSVFNAGMCHILGRGTNMSVAEGKRYLDVGVAKFGHFGSVHEVGKMHYNGAVRVAVSVSLNAVIATRW